MLRRVPLLFEVLPQKAADGGSIATIRRCHAPTRPRGREKQRARGFTLRPDVLATSANSVLRDVGCRAAEDLRDGLERLKRDVSTRTIPPAELRVGRRCTVARHDGHTMPSMALTVEAESVYPYFSTLIVGAM